MSTSAGVGGGRVGGGGGGGSLSVCLSGGCFFFVNCDICVS